MSHKCWMGQHFPQRAQGVSGSLLDYLSSSRDHTLWEEETTGKSLLDRGVSKVSGCRIANHLVWGEAEVIGGH